MIYYIKKYKNTLIYKLVVLCLLASFGLMSIAPSTALAQAIASPSSTFIPLSPAFTPTLVRGIRVYPDNPLKFDFIVDSGDTGLKGDDLKAESEKLIRYFLASLTLPEDELWVNLSPHEKDRIVPDALGSTEMGRDMLAQDYLLKQITASLTNPDSDLGKDFWSKIYKQAYEQYGTTNIPVDTFNKVWIMPSKAEVYVQDDKAFIVDSKLKVMLETDYLAQQKASSSSLLADSKANEPGAKSQELASKVVREVFIPALEKEVNTGKNFAQLRQIYNAIILSYWYKTNLKNSILNKVYSNQHKVKGIDLSNKETTDKIYGQYLETFKKGVCNMMKVEYDPYAKKSISRKYFAGGVDITEFGEGAGKIYKETRSRSAGSSLLTKMKFATIILVTAGFSLFGNGPVSARDNGLNPPNLYGITAMPSEPLLLVDEKVGNELSEIVPIDKDSIVYSQEFLIGGKKVNVIFSKEDRKRFGEAFEGGAEIRIYLGSIIRNTQKTLDSLFSKGNFLEGSIDSAALSGVTTQELGVSLAIDLARLVLIHEIIHEKRFQNDFRSQHDAELNYLFREVELREGLERGAALELEAYLGMLCSGNYAKLIFSKLLLMEYSLKDSGKEEPYVSRIISRGLLDRMGYRKFIRKHHPESLKDFKTGEIYHNLDFIKEFRASFQAEELKMRAFYFSRRVFLKDPIIHIDFNMDSIEGYIKQSHFKKPADSTKNPIDQGFNSPIKSLRDQPREGQKAQGQAQTTVSSAIVFSRGLTETDVKTFEMAKKDTAATDLDDFELGLNTFVEELTGGEMSARMKKNIISTLEELIANSSSKTPTLQIPIWTYFYPVKNDKTGKERYIFELIIPASEKLDPKIDNWNMLKRNQEIFKVHGFEGLRVDDPKASGQKYQDGVRVRDQEYQNQGRGLDWVSSLMADTGVFLKYEKVPLKDGEGVTTHLYVDLTPMIVAHSPQPSLLKAGASSSSALTLEEQKAFADFENFLMTKKVFGFGEEEKDYTFFVNWADESSDDLHNLGIYLVDPTGRRLEHHVFIGRLSPLTKEFFIEDWNPFLSFAATQTLQALSQALPGYKIKGLLTIMQIVEQFDGFGVFYDEETGFFKKLKEDRSGYYWISENPESDSKRIMTGKEDKIISPEQLIAMTFFQDIEAASSFENVEIFWTKQENKGFKDALQRLMLYYADADAEDKVTQLGIGDPLLAGMGSIEEFGEFSFQAQFPENPQVISSSVASMKKVIEDFVDGRKAVFELNLADFEGMKSLGRFSDCKALDKLNEFFKTLPFEAESKIDYPWRSKNKHDTTIEMDLKEIIENSFDALESLEDARVLSRMPSDLRDIRSDVGQRKISVSLEVVGNNMVFKVADNGAGIYAATTKEKKEGGRYIGGYGEGSASLYYSLKNIKGKYRLQKAGEKGRTMQEGSVAIVEIPLASLKARNLKINLEERSASTPRASSSSLARLETARNIVSGLGKLVPVSLSAVQLKILMGNQKEEVLVYEQFLDPKNNKEILPYFENNVFRVELVIDGQPLFFIRKGAESVDLFYGWTQQGYQSYFQKYVAGNIENFIDNVYGDNVITVVEVFSPEGQEQFSCLFDIVLYDGGSYKDHSRASLGFVIDAQNEARIHFAYGADNKILTNNERLFRGLLPGMEKAWNENNKDQPLGPKVGSSSIVARSGVKIYTDAQGRRRVDMATVNDADLKDFLNGINQPELVKKVFVYGGAARDLLFGSSVRDIDYFLTLDMTEDVFRTKVFPRLQATTIMKKHNMGQRVRSLDDVRFNFGRTELSVNKMFLYFDGESPDPILEDPQDGLKDLMAQTARITNDNDEIETRQKFSRIMEKIIRFGLTPDGRAQRVLRDCILYYKGQLIDFPVFNVYQAWDAIIHSGVNEEKTQALWNAIERWQDSYRKDMAADRPMGLNDGEGELFEALGFKTPEGLEQHLEKVLSRTSGEAAVASSGIYGKWKDVMPKLLELADQKKVKVVYIDLDNTVFYPKGFVGSEKQKTESIIRVAVNLIIKDVEKGETFVSERTVAEAINQAKGLVYTQGDMDEARMVDHQFFASDVDHEKLRVLKNKGVHMIGFTARPSKPSKMRITLDILRSLRVNGDIFDKVVFTSGDGKIKANQLAFQIKEYRREAKERKKQINSKEIFLIDDLKKNIIAAGRLGYGISPVLIEADNGVENRTWEDFLELAKEAKQEKNLNHVFEYLLNAYVLAPKNEEGAILFLAFQMLGSENYDAFTQALAPDIGKMKDVFGNGVEMKDIVNPNKVFSSLINVDELEAFVGDQLNKSQVFESDYDPKRPGAASPLTKDTKGGIDFNSKNINVEVRGQAIDFALPDGITEENLMNAQGFVPVIINIVPVTNLYHLLGLIQEENLEGEPRPMAQGNSNPPREIAEVKS